MLTSASKSLPPIEYVSIVRSVYKDRRQMVVGTLATAVAAAATGAEAGSTLLYAHAGLFVLLTIIRFWDMSAFAHANIAADDVDGAAYWEVRATALAVLTAGIFGSWCFCSLSFANSPFEIGRAHV